MRAWKRSTAAEAPKNASGIFPFTKVTIQVMKPKICSP